MKKSVRNTILAAVCGTLVMSAGSCAFGVTYPLTIDGEQIRAGVYILEQQDAMYDATSKISEEQPDLDTSAEGFSYLSQTVEGKSFADWVNDKAVENCREYIAVKRLFDSYGLTLSQEDIDSIESNAKSMWNDENQYAQYFYGVDVVGEYYEKLGVSEQSYKDVQYVSEKREHLFDYLYGEEGIQKATQDEINSALQSDYSMVNYVQYQIENGDSAQSYADKIANGTSTFEQVWQEVTQAYNNEKFEKEQAEAAAAAAEAAANAENTEETADAADTTEDETPAEPEQAELPETDDKIEVIKKDATSPSEDFVAQVMDMAAGDVKVITTEDGSTYIVQKLDILSKPELTESEQDDLRSELKQDEFDQMISSTGAGYSLSVDGSKNTYKVDKLLDR